LRVGAGVNAITVAKAYRLLRANLNTAVDDSLIRRNPCRITGAGQEKSPERPVLTVEQVYQLAAAIGARYQAFVLLATFASLRWGELAGLPVGTSTSMLAPSRWPGRWPRPTGANFSLARRSLRLVGARSRFRR
jgi:hypothetical protein